MAIDDATDNEQELEGERFNIQDGQRPLTFLGEMLASTDSQSGSDVRWTELTLYRTNTGKYVIEKVGRSDVFHSDVCRRRSKGQRYDRLSDAAATSEDVEDAFVPCDECRPRFNVEPAWVERDIFTASVYESAPALIESLYKRDSDNMMYMSRVARTLLEAAAKEDDDVATVMQSPSDIT